MKTETVNPNVSNFIESLRDVGYSVQVAIADLIDNSISALSTSIEIYFAPNPTPIFALLDNGVGMLETELIEAMRLSSRSPNEVRAPHDLGRFGMGLKTASFSQCKKLTVASKKKGKISVRQWDLSFIASKNQWFLITPEKLDDFPLMEKLKEAEHGTLVVWEEIDRILPSAFANAIEKLRSHISLVFHRFLEGKVFEKKINISINGTYIKPFNPFNINHPATQQLAVEKINIFGSTINVQPFILPHHSKLSKEEYDMYATEDGYIKSQGFYLYRQDRIIIYGTWWGMHKATDANKLARIMIEIPNSIDVEWGIDIKKSIARPSEAIKNDLKRIVSAVIEKGTRPYAARGKKIEDKYTTQFWELYSGNGKFRFQLNKSHPIYQNLANNLNKQQLEDLHYYLKGLQAFLPLEAIQAKLQSDPINVDQTDALTDQEIIALAEKIRNGDFNEEIISSLLNTEIFKNRKELITNDKH